MQTTELPDLDTIRKMIVGGFLDDYLRALRNDIDERLHRTREFIEFVQGAELVIHNAPFDSGVLDHELGRIGSIRLGELCPRVIDTLQMARSLRPGRKNNLDALCVEFGIDNSGRQLHGALRDAELLADVWLALTRMQGALLDDAGTACPVDVLQLPATRIRRHA